MATTPRTVKEISSAIKTELQTLIPALTSNSAQAVWRFIADAFGVAGNVLETFYTAFEADIEGRAQEIPTGTRSWHASESLLFQNGFGIDFVDGNWIYADTTSQAAQDARIIKFAAVDVDNENLFIKVAKDDGSGLATPLSAPEVTAFTDYWEIKQFPGVNVNIVSQSGDLATISYLVGVDANVINPSNGQRYDDSTYPIEDAINNHLQTFQSVNFNGLFVVASLTDAIQAVAGVKNVIPQTVAIDGFDVLNDAQLKRTYITAAGWLQVDPSTPLASTLSYYDFDNG